MKKTIIIVAAILVVLVAAIAAIPLFFKKNLMEAAKTTINKQLDAEVGFAEFNLSVFRNFPKATIRLTDVYIVGKGEFRADTLLKMDNLLATMDLSSLFKKSGKNLEELVLQKPELNLMVGNSGKGNWEIAGSPAPTETPQTGTNQNPDAETFQLQLEKIEIVDADLIYHDKPAEMLVRLSGIDFAVSGGLYGSQTQLQTNGKVADFLLEYGGTAYVSNTSIETKTLLKVDYETMDFAILENELVLNRLPLEVTGGFQMPGDSMFFNLVLKTKDSGFENFLALVPPTYEKYLQGVETSGNATVSGEIKGLYFEEDYPAFDFKLDVENGNVHYADLPEQIEKINADVRISKPQGGLNLTEIKVSEAHAEIKNSPVDLTLSLTNLIDDLHFDGTFVGKINFNDLKDALPLDSANVSGSIDANLFVKGNYSDIENKKYDRIKSDGVVLLDNFVYDSPDFTRPIFVPEGQLEFSPENINLRRLSVKIGQSDFQLSGIVSNYLDYMLKDGTLKGTLQLTSNMVELNELMRLKKNEPVTVAVGDQTNSVENQNDAPQTESGAVAESLAFDIPQNVDLTCRSNIQKAVLDRMPISNINGQITARRGKLILDGLEMGMLDGTLKLNGAYQNTSQNQPLFDFGFDIRQFDIPLAYRTLSGMQKIMPVAAHSEGKISAVFKMNGQLSERHKVIPTSVDGAGQFSTTGLRIIGSPIFNQLKGLLKTEKLQDVAVDDFKANFEVENGNIDLKPFKTKIAGQETTMIGTLSAQNLIDMRLDFKVDRNAFGSDIQNILAVLPGNEKIMTVPAGVVIRGPVGNPEVKMDLSETRKTITDATKGELKNTLNKVGKGLLELFK